MLSEIVVPVLNKLTVIKLENFCFMTTNSNSKLMMVIIIIGAMDDVPCLFGCKKFNCHFHPFAGR
jgi:hypothetical protein